VKSNVGAATVIVTEYVTLCVWMVDGIEPASVAVPVIVTVKAVVIGTFPPKVTRSVSF
jgi:hypothetical protein